MNLKSYFGSVSAAALAVLLAGCGSSGTSDNGPDPKVGGATLKSVTYGRLVDVYSYRRIDARRADRRDTLNRVPVLVAENVVIRPTVETQGLFDPTGGVRADAHYRFMPFDVDVGHEELLILWDDQIPPEKDSFEKALVRATENLPDVVGSFRDQNTSIRPIPVVPRNAALKLTFDQDLGVAPTFFGVHPNAIQVLEFITDPSNKTRPNSFRPVMTRILGKGHEVIIDTSLVGGEARGGQTTAGLPASIDNVTANLRIALPTSGIVSKQLKFAEDPIVELNGVDSSGEKAVIRDFRSGNLADGKMGSLADVEKPMVVAHIPMGIIDIDEKERIITLNKRNADIVVRGRVPFVDGALDEVTDLASGPEMLPARETLRSGDVLMQMVLSPAGEFVRLRAEVLMNLDVGNKKGQLGFPTIGSARAGVFPRDGGQESTVRVLVGNLTAMDSQGNTVRFLTSALPLGQDCDVKVHYYEYVDGNLKLGTDKVSDSSRKTSFLVLDPEPPKLDPVTRKPVPAGSMVDPMANVSLRFSEPMDLLTVRPLQNYILTNKTINAGNVLEMLEEPKPSSLAILAVKLLDQTGDGTLLRLNPPLGHFHDQKLLDGEVYWFHMVLGREGIADLAGNVVDLYDRRANATQSFSIKYTLDTNAKTNAVASRIFRFENPDEDGTTLGSVDLWGQFQLLKGELRGAETKRFSAIADNQILSGILLYDRGECTLDADPTTNPPTPPSYAPFPIGYPPGVRYMCPSMVAVQGLPPLAFQPPAGPQVGGGVSEPHNQRGSRLQMTYREDDFGLGFKQTSKQMIDIEQMHWSPFNDTPVRFDTFDRYSMRLAHCDWRPDIAYLIIPPPPLPPPYFCVPDCFSLRGGLRDIFDDNVLQGSQYVRVVKDAVYEINPNDAFRAPSTGTKFVPYPKFERTYTWRDSRLATWDQVKDVAVGFGGAHQANADPAIRDTTTSVTAPFVPDIPPPLKAALHTNSDWVYDEGDFLGFRNRDHDPMALPLLMDFSVFPDGPENGGYALGTNQFHIALSGPCWSPISPGGYYNMTSVPGCAPLKWPYFRVHASGGIDPITGESKLIDPENTTTAQPSVIKDLFWGDPIQGLWTAPPQDDHVHWGQVDFVRRVSMATFGFWDTLKPNQHDLKYDTNWPGKGNKDGIPNLESLNMATGIQDFVSLMDPPISRQPVGTSVLIEYRGATSFDKNSVLFDQSVDTEPGTTSANIVQKRGNILNPLYAFEAYRYASQNPGPTSYNWLTTVQSGPRVKASGLTEYVADDKLDTIRLKTNDLLPRYINFRVIFENNLDANPPITPSLKSFAVVYRIAN